MRLTLEVADQQAGLLIEFLRTLPYVSRLAQTPVTPAPSDDSTTPETAPFQFTRVSGKWDEPDFDFAEFRRNAWGRDL